MLNPEHLEGLTIKEKLEVLKIALEETDKIMKHYEQCLDEVLEQKNLFKWLEENEKATTQDYFAYLVTETLRKVGLK